LGPLVGTALLILFRELVSGFWENYLIAVGVFVILVVMLAPRGIVGIFSDLVEGRDRRRAEAEASLRNLAEAE
jgi:branched-chain amino acid transport system permease protein